MEVDRYYELRTTLQRWLRRLADNIRSRIEERASTLRRLEKMYDQEGVSEEFTLWLDRWCRQAAIQFILRTLFLRVLEDRNLLGVTRLRTPDGQQMWQQLTRNLGAASYVQWCCWDAAHLLPDLFGPTDYDLVLPAGDLVQQFLDDVWRRPDANRAGWLRYDFRPDLAQGDAGFQTRFIGDLYQELDAEIRERYALLQTPHFISQFILEHTLLKRFQAKDFREVTLIDPTCGSAHFLVDAFWLFVTKYEKALGKTRTELTAAERTQVARTIIEKHLYGCDINPYATTLAQFRLLLAACGYAQPVSLEDLRDLHFNIVTIDSLIPHEKSSIGELRKDSILTQIWGSPELVQKALPILQRRYSIVIGNPPYIVERDKYRKKLYTSIYPLSASGKFHLGAPFTERFFQLAEADGLIGLINSNAFTKRDFGKSLIEEFLSSVNLESIVDLSTVSVPNHGTPTIILFGTNSPRQGDNITVVACIQEHTANLLKSTKDDNWEKIVTNFLGRSYHDEQIWITERSWTEFQKHPWDFRFNQIDLLKRIALRSLPLSTYAIEDGIGVSLFTLLDEIFVQPIEVFRRYKINSELIRLIVLGEEIRDWEILANSYVLFPYRVIDNKPEPIDISQNPQLERFLSPYRRLLNSSHTATSKSTKTSWYEYGRFTLEKYQGSERIAFPAIATHNHFIVNLGSSYQVLFKQSAPLIKLAEDHYEANLLIVALLNSPIACLHIKQNCYNKGAGSDSIRDRYDLSGRVVALIPIAESYSSLLSKQLILLAEEAVKLSKELRSLRMSQIFFCETEAYFSWMSNLANFIPPHSDIGHAFKNTNELQEKTSWATALREDIRQRLIFLQEEMDWLVYEMYGLAHKAPIALDYLTSREFEQARLQLGQRTFELIGKGYQGDWLLGYQPSLLPGYLRPLFEARLTIIQANPDIALLEDPLYKRRWSPPDYDQEFREAAEWWLAEKLEYALEHYGRPITLRQWVQLLRNDERVNAALEVLTGSPMFDLEQELHRVIEDNAVSNRPEHYLKPASLRQLQVEGTEFKSSDFSDSTTWRLRGKLNIPRERFIAYREFDHSWRGSNAPDSGGPWYGWAGWDAVQRAEALAFLLDQANRAGWEVDYRQCGLRAALRNLLSELRATLPADEVLEFAGIAQLCGIDLDTRCYCRAYREGVAATDHPRSGAPGVTIEAITSLATPATKKRKPPAKARPQADAEQLAFALPTEAAEDEE